MKKVLDCVKRSLFHGGIFEEDYQQIPAEIQSNSVRSRTIMI